MAGFYAHACAGPTVGQPAPRSRAMAFRSEHSILSKQYSSMRSRISEGGNLGRVYQTAQTAILAARILTSTKVMEDLTTDVLGEWESEGGATTCLDVFANLTTPGFGSNTAVKTLVGTPNQIEWAEQIKDRVQKEFDRVGMILKSVAAKQVGWDQTDTLKLVAILEEKRRDVMANDRAGYFIHDWQELSDQVREMVVQDPRFGKIMARQAARKHAITTTNEDQQPHWPEGAEL
jgi:hypothetical protein